MKFFLFIDTYASLADREFFQAVGVFRMMQLTPPHGLSDCSGNGTTLATLKDYEVGIR